MVTTENYDTNKNCGTNISRTKIAINSKFGEVTSYVLKYGLSRQNFILPNTCARKLKKHCFHGNYGKTTNFKKLST